MSDNYIYLNVLISETCFAQQREPTLSDSAGQRQLLGCPEVRIGNNLLLLHGAVHSGLQGDKAKVPFNIRIAGRMLVRLDTKILVAY